MEVDYIENGNCLDLMKTLPDNCIDLTVTSPPYDNLRTYNGYSFDFENIAKELYRITKEGGVVVWVVSDATIDGSETGTSFRQALYFKEIGFNIHDTEIYAKNNPIPQNHNRYEQCFEYMFIFSKGKPKTFNGLQVETKNNGKSFTWGNRKTKLDNKQCRRHRETDDKLTVKPTKLHTNIFYYSIGGGDTGHPAVFPDELAKEQIITWSDEDDVVFDPFLGSGTTAIQAMFLKRHYIGFEISDEYYNICCKRLERAEQENRQISIFDMLGDQNV